MATIKNLNVSQAVNNAQLLLKNESSLSDVAKTVFQTLIDVVTLLYNRLGRNSKNSSLPPSKDPYWRVRKKSQSKGIKRQQGAQRGHSGFTLKRVEDPDEIEELQVDRRTVPQGFYKILGYETRQVFDIHISLSVKEHRAAIIENQQGDQYVAEFPAGVIQAAQYGNSTKASSVYLSQFQLIPLERVKNYFQDQAGIPISKDVIANFNVEASQKLEAFEQWAKQQLITSLVNHADETGINVGGKKFGSIIYRMIKLPYFMPMKTEEKRLWIEWGFYLTLPKFCAMTIGSLIFNIRVRILFAMLITLVNWNDA